MFRVSAQLRPASAGRQTFEFRVERIRFMRNRFLACFRMFTRLSHRMVGRTRGSSELRAIFRVFGESGLLHDANKSSPHRAVQGAT